MSTIGPPGAQLNAEQADNFEDVRRSLQPPDFVMR